MYLSSSYLLKYVILFFSQVLIATSTLAWGVNFPAHLVVVKGTEYYDGKSRRYVDYPITGTQASLQLNHRAKCTNIMDIIILY